MSEVKHPDSNRIKAIFFDFMGTCLNWHENVVEQLPRRIHSEDRSHLALTWRQTFFDEISARYNAGQPQEDIDETHRRTLHNLISGKPEYADIRLTAEEIEAAVKSWHSMTAWPEVHAVLNQLRSTCECFVLANGTTRLQLDLVRSSGLEFDMLFSSELLQLTKPDPAMYHRAMELVKAQPSQCVMVAAHAYDLRAAKSTGMKTVYIRRWTEDINEEMKQVRLENDAFCADMNGLPMVIADGFAPDGVRKTGDQAPPT